MRPTREDATSNGQTYMITSSTWGRRALFSREAWAKLLIDTLYRYRGSAYLLHEFVIMPDHIHVLLTPKTGLEKAVQFIKGGFSYWAKRVLGSHLEVWQKGFSDHRIRDANDYRIHQIYVQQNPVRNHLCERAEEYPYSSARPGFDLDPAPQGLKPLLGSDACGAPKGAPFQSNAPREDASSQENFSSGAVEGSLVEPKVPIERRESALLQGVVAKGANKIASARATAAPQAPKNRTA